MGENIAKFIEMQNEIVLDYIAHPETYKTQPSYSEDPWGQPVYTDKDGNVYHIHRENDYNGWTI